MAFNPCGSQCGREHCREAMWEGNRCNANQALETGLAAMHLSSGVPREDAEFDSEEEDEEDVLVTLGFVQAAENEWKLQRHQFPSKVGGAPAWLDPVNIPEGDQTRCGACGNPLGFLLQVYAPLREEGGGLDQREDVFHRTLFVFVCQNMACLQQDQHLQYERSSQSLCRSVRVFRSQLPRRNPFYSYQPPSGLQDSSSCEGAPLCTWCGTWKANIVCGVCRQERYCCGIHQREHWIAGHSAFCGQIQAVTGATQHVPPSSLGLRPLTSGAANPNGGLALPLLTPPSTETSNPVQTMVHDVLNRVVATTSRRPGIAKLWPEMELIVDEEENFEPTGVSQNSTSMTQHLPNVYEKSREDGEEFSASDMQDVEDSLSEQQKWAAFQAHIARAPDQVLRYSRVVGAKPLWPSVENRVPSSSDIPPCSNCGGPRIFELQLMPQLLYFLGVHNAPESDSLDWATIAVYACASSCCIATSGRKGYLEEFPWVQLAVT